MIYVNENRAQIVKGDFHPAALYKGDKKIAGYVTKGFESEGGITLESCYNDKLHRAKIIGNSVQEGTVSPESPVEIKSVGDLVTEGEHSGKYKIGVTVRGKNLLKNPLDLRLWKKGALPSLSGYAYILGDLLTDNTSVTLSFKYDAFPTHFQFRTDDEDIIGNELNQETGIRTIYLTTGEVVNSTFTFVPKKDRIYALYCARSTNYATEEAAQAWLEKFSYIQLETGATATDFEEYKEPQSFNLYLDEPLFKVGEHKDYIDFENEKIIRNVSIKKLTGDEIWYRGGYRLYSPIGNITGLNSDEKHCISNYFAAFTWNELYQNGQLETKKIGVALQSGINLCVTPAQVVPTVEEWKAQLSAWNDKGTPLTVVYASAMREEKIPALTLPTFRGTTIYEIDTEVFPKISGEYKEV